MVKVIARTAHEAVCSRAEANVAITGAGYAAASVVVEGGPAGVAVACVPARVAALRAKLAAVTCPVTSVALQTALDGGPRTGDAGRVAVGA